MAYVQTSAATYENEFPLDVTSASIDTTTGNAVVVFCTCSTYKTMQSGDLTDSNSNSWTFVGQVTNEDGTTLGAWYCASITGGSGHTFRFQRADASYGTVSAVEWSGISGHEADDTVENANATTMDTGGVSTSNAADCAAAFIADDEAGTWAAGTGFTSRVERDSLPRYLIETQENISAGTNSATATRGGATGYGGIAVFLTRGAAGAGSHAAARGRFLTQMRG